MRIQSSLGECVSPATSGEVRLRVSLGTEFRMGFADGSTHPAALCGRLFPMLAVVNQKRLGRRKKSRRVRQCFGQGPPSPSDYPRFGCRGPSASGNMLSYIARASLIRRARSSSDFGTNRITSPMEYSQSKARRADGGRVSSELWPSKLAHAHGRSAEAPRR